MFATKLVYTFFGATAGMLAWYISAGLGDGNCYSYVVVCGVVYLITSYYRHFPLHALPIASLMMCNAPTLVLGTSWTNAHYHTLDVGEGWRVTIVRFVSVAAGLTVVFTVTLFPKVRSSKSAVRKRFAVTLEHFNDIQNQICTFALKRYDDHKQHIRVKKNKLLNELRALLSYLAA